MRGVSPCVVEQIQRSADRERNRSWSYVTSPWAIQKYWEVISAAVADEVDLAQFLTNRAYTQSIPLDSLREKDRDALVTEILFNRRFLV